MAFQVGFLMCDVLLLLLLLFFSIIVIIFALVCVLMYFIRPTGVGLVRLAKQELHAVGMTPQAEGLLLF